jgi:hypothetical protein
MLQGGPDWIIIGSDAYLVVSNPPPLKGGARGGISGALLRYRP